MLSPKITFFILSISTSLMRLITIYLLTGFLLLGNALSAQDTRIFSLQEAIDYATENHNKMKVVAMDKLDAALQVKEYKSVGLPQVNGEATYTHFFDIPTSILPDFISPSIDGRLIQYQLIDPSQVPPYSGAGFPAQFGTNNTFGASVSAGWLAFDFAYLVGLEAVKQLKDLVGRQGELTAVTIRQDVTSAYYTVVYAKESRKVLEDNIKNLEKTIAELRQFYTQGLIEKLDLERLEYSLGSLKIELDAVNQQLGVALILLKFNMGYDMNGVIDISEDMNTLLAKTSMANTNAEVEYSNRLEYDILKRSLSLNDINVKRLKAAYLPSLSAFASYSQNIQRNNLFDSDEAGFFPTTLAGVTLNVPIFSGFGRKAKIDRASIERDKVNLQINDFERAMDLQVQVARTNLAVARQRLENSRKNQELAEKIYKTTQIKFKEGIGTSLEVTQAESDLYQAQGNVVSSNYQVLTTWFELQKALGQ